MNGRELSEKLITISPGMKVLYMSGYMADIIATHGVISNDVKFLQKPFSIESLSSKVREVHDAKYTQPQANGIEVRFN
ncbi:MAG: FixJ family two-component response regulator [Oleiphilaceae bacterium]|jgi:FixJ family two-component response regulator